MIRRRESSVRDGAMKPSILIVEDSSLEVMYLRELLTGLGYTVAGSFDSGEGAVEFCGKNRPDLILMDIMLKGRLDGVEAGKIINERYHIPVIYVTALTDGKVMERARITHAYGYLIKPFQERELHNTIEMALYNHAVTRKLLESEERYRTLVENINDVIFTVDKKGIMTYISPVSERMTGHKPEEIIGKSFVSFIHPEDLSRITKGFMESIAGRPASREFRILAADGRAVYVRTSGRLNYDDGMVSGLTSVMTDITDRKLAEEELSKAHNHIRYLLSSIHSIVIGVSTEDTITHWNPAAEKILGCEYANVIGRKVSETGIGWEWDVIFEGIAESIASDAPVHLDNVGITRCDGKERLLEMMVSPMKDDSGALYGFILWGRDITEKRMMERELAQARRLESIGQLAAGVAHEINTPMQYIYDNINYIKDEFEGFTAYFSDLQRLLTAASAAAPQMKEELLTAANNERVLDNIREIPRAIADSLHGAEHVTRIVRSMREFSHPGTTEKVSADINRLLESVITISRNEWKYTAEMVTDFDPELPAVMCNPGELNQAVLNIIINAAHAIEDRGKTEGGKRGTITVSTKHGEDIVEIIIGDTGPGIPPGIQDRIFDPFFTTKEAGRGTGQGLAIAHNIITKKHGGGISFRSTQGEGTTFSIKIPVSPAEG